MKQSPKYYLVNDLLTHLAFIVWAVLAFYFFQERLYSDTGFYIAKVVHYGCFWVDLDRFVLVFSQWLPLLCLKLGCSLQVVLVAYSVGHVLFFYGIYWIGRYVWQNHEIGWFLLLIQTVGILHGFCTPGFELYYASAFLALFSVILNTNDFSLKNQIYLFLLTGIMVTSHQIIIFMGLAVVCLHGVSYRFEYWKQYLGILGLIVFYLGIKQTLTPYRYEAAKMEQFILNLTTRAYTWENYIKPLWIFYGQYYKELVVIALLSLLFYIKKKQYSIALGYLLFLCLIQYIIALTYPSIQHSRYQEQCFFPLIFVVCFPLVMDIKKQLLGKWKWSITLGIFALVCYRFLLISVAIEPFTHRVNYMHRIIEAGQKMEGNKFIAYESWWNETFGGMSFTMGMESILLSGLNPKQKTIQIIRDTEWLWQDSANVHTLQDTNLYMFTYRSFYDRRDSIYKHSEIDTQYFNFPPGKYRYLNGYAPLVDSIQQLKNALTIETYPEPAYAANETANILIALTNHSAQPINSHQIRVAYHWWKDGKIVHWEGHRNALELDLLAKDKYRQYIMVIMPSEVGDYELQVDVIAGKKLGWMHYPKRVPIKIY